MLKNWHTCLFANARNLTIGDWRRGTEPMQVVSVALDQEKVHFEAPPSWRVGPEMEAFVDWFNGFKPLPDNPIASAMLKSAISHLYFESIHPFEDGNGRIGRAIAEKALAQGMNRPLMLSISKIIEADKNAYYQALKLGQSSLQIDTWLKYFLNVLINAQREARMTVALLLKKVRFFDSHKSALEDRHSKVLSKMFDAGPSGFVGGMSAKKYMSITHVSKATATRDLQYLVQQGVFTKEGEGRSVRYHLNLGEGA
jgi:Fic family protein